MRKEVFKCRITIMLFDLFAFCLLAPAKQLWAGRAIYDQLRDSRNGSSVGVWLTFSFQIFKGKEPTGGDRQVSHKNSFQFY